MIQKQKYEKVSETLKDGQKTETNQTNNRTVQFRRWQIKTAKSGSKPWYETEVATVVVAVEVEISIFSGV